MWAAIAWDPDKNLFIIPYLNHPITWYGFLFATGLMLAYFLCRRLFIDLCADPSKSPEACEIQAIHLADRFCMSIVAGLLLGARLGHVFFYDWNYYSHYPSHILRIWEGGLASHGAAIGMVVALYIFVRFSKKNIPNLTGITALDMVALTTPLAGGFIRIGNFMNQEITGVPTSLPWGVIFGSPIDGIAGIPLHPVQLYEAIFYFLVFGFLVTIWMKNKKILGRGLLSGWCLVLIFSFRFFIEWLKMPQNLAYDVDSYFRVGQLLSLPFIIFGVCLLIYAYRHAEQKK